MHFRKHYHEPLLINSILNRPIRLASAVPNPSPHYQRHMKLTSWLSVLITGMKSNVRMAIFWSVCHSRLLQSGWEKKVASYHWVCRYIMKNIYYCQSKAKLLVILYFSHIDWVSHTGLYYCMCHSVQYFTVCTVTHRVAKSHSHTLNWLTKTYYVFGHSNESFSRAHTG